MIGRIGHSRGPDRHARCARACGPPAGYVLVGVLWAVVALAALAIAAGAAGRDAVAAAANRGSLTRAAWIAEDCAARALAAADLALTDAAGRGGTAGAGSPEALARAWRALDRVVAGSPLLADAPRACALRLTAAGVALALDLEAEDAQADALHRLLAALHVAAPHADSLVDALLDWRDTDDVPRPAGAEAAWYLAHGRPPPRNAPFAAVAELDRVRGFDSTSLDARTPDLHAALRGAVAVGGERVDLAHAPAAVLMTLPGVTPEVADAIAATRGGAAGAPVDVNALAARLSQDVAIRLLEHGRVLQARTTTEPEAWTVTARATDGAPAVTSVLALRVVRAGARLAVVRRQTWAE